MGSTWVRTQPCRVCGKMLLVPRSGPRLEFPATAVCGAACALKEIET